MIPLIIVCVVIVVWFFGSFTIVQQQTAKIIQRLGKFNKVAKAGINFKLPFIDSVVDTVNLQIQQLGEDVVAKSKDNSFITIPVKVQFQVTDAEKAYYQLSNASEQMRAYVTNVVRSEATTMTMEEIFQSKDAFQTAVQSALTEKFTGFGFSIVNVLVDNPLPSKDVIDSFNRVISSQRLKEAAVNEAEAIRVKTVAVAHAEAESLTLKAEAYVKQRKTVAEGLKEVIESADTNLIPFLVGLDYRDMLREASKGAGTIILPYGTEEVGLLLSKMKK